MGIRDFIELLSEHRRRLARGPDLPDSERAQTRKEAEMMVGMADAAVRELESVLNNRRVNLPEEHAIRFAQDIFTHLKAEEERVKAEIQSA